MRTAIIIYFWICAVLVLALSLGTELSKENKRQAEQKRKGRTPGIHAIRAGAPATGENSGKQSPPVKLAA